MKELPPFPDIVPSKIAESVLYVVEADDIQTEADLQKFILLLYNYPERYVYFFQEKGGTSNLLLERARDRHEILMDDVEFFHFRHPTLAHYYTKIERRDGKYRWEWEKEVVEKGPMFMRIRLQLTEKKKRRLEIEERIAIEKESQSNPTEEILGFKNHIERQAHTDIFVNGNPQENIARALLQAYLSTRSYREVPVRGGRSDILSFSKSGRFLYETKIWRGRNYHEQGLRELHEYILGEGDDRDLAGIFYIIFDPTKGNNARNYLGSHITTLKLGNRDVQIVVIDLALPQPSKKE